MATCKQCGAELKNDRCSSCGYIPNAPKQGKTEAQLRDEAEAKRIRQIVQGGAQPAQPAPAQNDAQPAQPATDNAAPGAAPTVPNGGFHQ